MSVLLSMSGALQRPHIGIIIIIFSMHYNTLILIIHLNCNVKVERMKALQNHSLEVLVGTYWQCCQNQMYPIRCQWHMMVLKGIMKHNTVLIFTYIYYYFRVIESGEEVVMRTRIPRYVNPMVRVENYYYILF